jgi:predicted DNA-binding transcriptional regulator AlpA
MLKVKEAAIVARVSVSYLNKTRCYGGGPKYLKLGRSVRYDARDLAEWMEGNKRSTTGEVSK